MYYFKHKDISYFSLFFTCIFKQNIYLCNHKISNGGIAQSVEQRTENPCVRFQVLPPQKKQLVPNCFF